MPIYCYKNEKTGEIFEKLRSINERDNPYIDKDGEECKRVEVPDSMGYCGLHTNEREIWQIDREYLHLVKPKKIKLRSGKVVKFRPDYHT